MGHATEAGSTHGLCHRGKIHPWAKPQKLNPPVGRATEAGPTYESGYRGKTHPWATNTTTKLKGNNKYAMHETDSEMYEHVSELTHMNDRRS